MATSQPTPKAPVTTLEPHEIEQARKRDLLSKVREMRSSVLSSKGKVRASDPAKSLPQDRVYVWVNRHETRIVYFQSMGYQVCKDPRVTTDWKREDETHAYGDMILMDIDRELHQAIKLDGELRALEGVEGEDLFKSFAERVGIPVSTPKN